MLFSWFKTLFTSGSENVSASSAVGSTHKTDRFEIPMSAQEIDLSIPYYPNLLDLLEKDHKHLLDFYTHISHTLALKQYHLIPAQLGQFKSDFKEHLDEKNIKFYGYLEQTYKNENVQFAELRRFRKEMRSIERTVIKFLDYWINYGIDRKSVV